MADDTRPSAAQPNESSETTPLLNEPRRRPTGFGPSETDSIPEPELPDQDRETTVIADGVSPTRLTLILGAAYLGVFLGAIDSTIIATLSAPISSEFKSLSLLSWLATAYLISNAACQPLSGRLTDIFGRGPGLIFSNVFFAAGNLICGLAQDQHVMIFGRVIAGIGGGGLMSISTFLASDLVPLRKRGIIQGVGNIAYGGGAMLGGVFGGLINDHTAWGWRLAFLIQVPPVIVSAIIVAVLVRVPPKASDKSYLARIDFVGAFLTISFLVLLLLGLNAGGNIVPWLHPLPLTTIPLSVVAFVAFIIWESRAKQPIIPVKLLMHRTVIAACLCNFLSTMVIMMALFYVPLYLQVIGLSATDAGLRLLPSPLGISVFSLGCGYLMKKTGRYLLLGTAVLTLLTIAVAVLCSFDEKTPTWTGGVVFFMAGGGYGGMLTITLLACIAAVDHSQQAVITSATCTSRKIAPFDSRSPGRPSLLCTVTDDEPQTWLAAAAAPLASRSVPPSTRTSSRPTSGPASVTTPTPPRSSPASGMISTSCTGCHPAGNKASSNLSWAPSAVYGSPCWDSRSWR